MKKSQADRVLELARKVGIVRPRDLKTLGIPQGYLWRVHRRGLLERVGRGLYTTKDGSATENHSLAEAAKRVPHAVVCLISALSFHADSARSVAGDWPQGPQPQAEWPVAAHRPVLR